MQAEQKDAVGRARRDPDASRPAPRLLATLCFSADQDFLALARSTTKQVAGLLGFPHGRITDLRLAVDEACSLFLADGPPTEAAGIDGSPDGSIGALALVFADAGGELRITVSGRAPRGRRPDPDGLAWTLLCALVGEPGWNDEDGVGVLTLREPMPLVGADFPWG